MKVSSSTKGTVVGTVYIVLIVAGLIFSTLVTLTGHRCNRACDDPYGNGSGVEYPQR